jgi:uncharacterized membrane protein
MEARQVSAGNAWGWIVGGFNLFRQNPVIWIALFFIYLLVAMVLSIIPLVGPIVLNLLAPVFMAGFMLGCRALEMDEELEINHLFAGFKNNTAQLVTVGGIYLVGAILIVGLVFVVVGADAMTGLFEGQIDPARPALDTQPNPAVPGVALLIVLGAMLPLIMAYWYAPALVLFHDMKALEAMRLSFFACLRNVLPFMVYGAILAVLVVLAMIPLGLGLLVMIPTMTASLYVSYKDIFNIGKLEVDEVLTEN